MRKGFKFYRSYYDVAKELKQSDRDKFLWALLQKQFEGIEPDLDGMSRFAYLSQKHSIDSQVAGYEAKTNTTLGGCQGGAEGGSVQEKEEVQEKVEYTIDFDKLLSYINKATGKRYKTINKTVKGKYVARLKEGYTIRDIQSTIDNSVNNQYHRETNYQYLTPEYFSRANTIDKFSQVIKVSDLPPLDKGVANAALNVPAMLDKLLQDGYTKEQINNYAK